MPTVLSVLGSRLTRAGTTHRTGSLSAAAVQKFMLLATRVLNLNLKFQSHHWHFRVVRGRLPVAAASGSPQPEAEAGSESLRVPNKFEYISESLRTWRQCLPSGVPTVLRRGGGC